MTDSEIIDYIHEVALPVGQLPQTQYAMFQWLSDEIYEGKAKIKTNSVQFVIVDARNRQGKPRRFNRSGFFNVYVIGDFRKTFEPVKRVAEAFSEFYLEMGILPNIIPIPKHLFRKDHKIQQTVKNGVLLYERR